MLIQHNAPMTYLKRTATIAIICLIVFLTGCASLNTLNAIVPDGDAIKTANIAYGENTWQTLDIYQPAVRSNNTPVIVFFYGGRWQSGSREEYAFVGQSLANRGYISIIADYGLHPSVLFPTFLQDAAKATSWVYKHIQKYDGDPQQIYLMGHSAGAHIATMLGTNKTFLNAEGLVPQQLKGVISLSGPLNFKITDDDIKAVFKQAKTYADTQPISFVNGDEPPMLLLHGEKDTTVFPNNSYSMANAIKQFDGQATVITYKELSHVGVLLALANAPFLYFAPVLDDIDAFVKQR